MGQSGIRRIRQALRKLVSAVTAFAMIAIGLVAVSVLAPVAGAQPAAAATYAPNAYITNQASNTVSVIRLSDLSTQATVTVGTTPYAAAETPDASKDYVSNSGCHT